MKVSIRDEKSVLQVIDLCMRLEERALLIYQNMRELSPPGRLQDLWAAMAADEKEHRSYWLRLKEFSLIGGPPEVFDEPHRYVDELKALGERLEHLAVRVRSDPGPPGVFIHALHLEYLLLHPAIVTLFHYLPENQGTPSPSLTYEKHLGKLLNALMDYESLPPELELLGEAIGQLWRKSAENATHAFTDLLTGTLNRRGLAVAMKPLAYLARREKQSAGVLILEVTNLKEANRIHGRRAGDELLAAVARVISNRLRASDVVGRFGGDDFLALLTRFEPLSFEVVCNELLALVGAVAIQGFRPELTLGGAWGPVEGDVVRRVEDMVRAADGALITAREGGMPIRVRKLE